MSPRRAHGSLEATVLRLLWDEGRPLTSRDVRDALADAGDELAATTVLTVLSRLEKKGLVERDTATKTYRATRTDPGATAQSMTEVLDRSADRSLVLQRFTGALGDEDLAVLRAALGARADGAAGRPDQR